MHIVRALAFVYFAVISPISATPHRIAVANGVNGVCADQPFTHASYNVTISRAADAVYLMRRAEYDRIRGIIAANPSEWEFIPVYYETFSCPGSDTDTIVTSCSRDTGRFFENNPQTFCVVVLNTWPHNIEATVNVVFDNGPMVLSGGAIAGITVGVIALVGALVGGGFVYHRKKKAQERASTFNVNKLPATQSFVAGGALSYAPTVITSPSLFPQQAVYDPSTNMMYAVASPGMHPQGVAPLTSPVMMATQPPIMAASPGAIPMNSPGLMATGMAPPVQNAPVASPVVMAVAGNGAGVAGNVA